MTKQKIRKRLIKLLDKEFSKATLEYNVKQSGGKCEFCNRPAVQCFHYITRANYKTRWRFFNSCATCRGCNLRMEFDPAPFYLHYIEKYGIDAFKSLVRESRGESNYTIDDLEKILDGIRAVGKIHINRED